MLSVYRRHRKNWPNAHDRVSKKGCRCKWWATGTLEGHPYRKRPKTANHDRAEQIVREIEAGTFAPIAAPTFLTYEDASQRSVRKTPGGIPRARYDPKIPASSRSPRRTEDR